MTYLVDSNWLILALHGEPEAVAFVDALLNDGVAINMVIYMEAFQGLDREPDPERAKAQFQQLLTQIPVLPFSFAVARRCASVRETLRDQKKRVNSRALDLINAATALEYDLVMVTQNINDYQDLVGAVGLKLYQPPVLDKPAAVEPESEPTISEAAAEDPQP